MAIRWIFFDIGDVLFDEDAQHQIYFHSMLLALRRNHVDVAWDEYHARVQELARTKPAEAVIDAAHHYVSDEQLWTKIHREGRGEYDAIRRPRPFGTLLDGIQMVVQDLHRDYRLGIIANQHPPITDAIRDYGLQPLFDVVAINEIVGPSKPDPALFEWSLEQAGCRPEEAIMVGDRADNDIGPARALGMGAVRFRRGILYVFYDPLTDIERADVEVREIMQLAPAVRRLADMRTG